MILYVPVIHDGYMQLFQKYAGQVDIVFVFGRTWLKKLGATEEIRAIIPSVAQQLIQSLGLFRDVRILGERSLSTLDGYEIILVDDEISRKFTSGYLRGRSIKYERVFLRWDEKSVFSKSNVNYDRISKSRHDRKMMALVRGEAQKTSDWWRQVGAMVLSGKTILSLVHNRHLPDNNMQYAYGDPRDFVKAGERSELTSAIHAEQAIIAESACNGVSLKGTDLYITTFPCPICAKLIAFAGIKRLFYATGHASLDGEKVLKAFEVEIVLVK